MNASAVELFDFEDFVHKMDRELLPKVHRHSKVTLENGRQHVFAAPAYFKSFGVQETDFCSRIKIRKTSFVKI